MFILRRITEGSLQVNTSLGIEYVMVLRETNSEEFKERTALWSGEDLVDVYGIVAFNDGNNIMPLYRGSNYYIMASDGQTFDNISEK